MMAIAMGAGRRRKTIMSRDIRTLSHMKIVVFVCLSIAWFELLPVALIIIIFIKNVSWQPKELG